MPQGSPATSWPVRSGDEYGTDAAACERLFEGAAEVEGAEARDLGKSAKRNLVGNVLLDVVCDGTLLPAGESTLEGCARCTKANPHEFVGEHNT